MNIIPDVAIYGHPSIQTIQSKFPPIPFTFFGDEKVLTEKTFKNADELVDFFAPILLNDLFLYPLFVVYQSEKRSKGVSSGEFQLLGKFLGGISRPR